MSLQKQAYCKEVWEEGDQLAVLVQDTSPALASLTWSVPIRHRCLNAA